MKTLDTPRTISSTITFNALVDWFHNDILLARKAPGFLVGLSGTDSLVAFHAAYKALEKAGKANRMMGVHFAPSEDFLYDHPEAEVHLWFRDEILPWLRKQAPQANIIVDTSIDWRCDGQRWGALMDLSVVSNDKRRIMRSPEEQYWVVGTRNRTEHVLSNFSNVSKSVSLQPLIHHWKSEVLQLSEYLGIPKIAINKSCETDCICGRLDLAAHYIKEMDALLMARCGELDHKYIEQNIPKELCFRLESFIKAQIEQNCFKQFIPYTPHPSVIDWRNDPLVVSFEEGSLNLKEFNHRQHLYVAWCYLQDMPLSEAVSCYSHYLQYILNNAGQSKRFSLTVTQSYFEKLELAMKLNPSSGFDELYEKSLDLLKAK